MCIVKKKSIASHNDVFLTKLAKNCYLPNN